MEKAAWLLRSAANLANVFLLLESVLCIAKDVKPFGPFPLLCLAICFPDAADADAIIDCSHYLNGTI
jgi:hypothetical protein